MTHEYNYLDLKKLWDLIIVLLDLNSKYGNYVALPRYKANKHLLNKVFVILVHGLFKFAREHFQMDHIEKTSIGESKPTVT